MSPQREATVVGLGLCVVDHLYAVDRFELADERTRYADRVESVGGMVATALVQAARLGCGARLISALGDDAAGRFARRSLREGGVDTRGVVSSRHPPTGIAVVLVHRRTGERRFLVADRRAVERRTPRLDVAPVRGAAVLLLDAHFPADALRAARTARSRGIPVVADLNRPSKAALRLLPLVDYALVSASFARDYTPGRARDTLLRLRDEFGAVAVVTQGARGGIYLEGGRVRRFGSPRVRVRDSTGAGDAFHGAFAAGLVQGLPLGANLARSARCGAQVTRRMGGVAALLGDRPGDHSGSR
jgi:sugar/nucleoside kinase (ribokinase family)